MRRRRQCFLLFLLSALVGWVGTHIRVRPLLKDAWERLESDDAYARREADVLLPFDGASNSLSEGTPASGPKATSKVDDGLLMQDDQQSLGGPDASPALGLPPWPTPCAGVSAKKKLVPLLDLINATMARISTADMFVTAKGVKEQGWTGPGRFKQASMQEKGRMALLPGSNRTVLSYWKRRESCAAVGNSGHLKLSNFGKIIDSHDFQLRLNQAPTSGYEKWVGKKAALRLINYSWMRKYTDLILEAGGAGKRSGGSRGLLSDRFPARLDASRLKQHSALAAGLQRRAQPHPGRAAPSVAAAPPRSPPDAQVRRASLVGNGVEVPLEQGVTVVYRWQTGNSAHEALEMVWVIQAARRDVKVLIVGARFRQVMMGLMQTLNARLRCAKMQPEGGTSPSSGLLAIFMLMHLCKTVDVYGYGSAAKGGRKVPYHYYTNLGERSWSTKATIHSFNAEQKLIEGLASAGYIRLCNDGSSPSCGGD